MVRKAEILLRDLKFGNDLCLWHRSDLRMERLTRLKIDRTIFNLQQNVGGKLAVERLELFISCAGAVVIGFHVINKGAPNHYAVMGRDRGCQHVGSIGVRSIVGAGSRLAFAVRFYEKTAEVRNQAVDLISLLLPPRNDFGCQRIRSLEATQVDWSREPR